MLLELIIAILSVIGITICFTAFMMAIILLIFFIFHIADKLFDYLNKLYKE